MSSTQLTLRSVDPELSRRLPAISQEHGDSLNSTVSRLLRDAVGLHARRDRLRRYAGWMPDDFEEFDAAMRAQRVVGARSWE